MTRIQVFSPYTTFLGCHFPHTTVSGFFFWISGDSRCIVTATFDFPKEEEKVLAFWKEIDAFRTSLKLSEGRPEYSFYDGPPFATGLPHYGHLLAGTIKVFLKSSAKTKQVLRLDLLSSGYCYSACAC